MANPRSKRSNTFQADEFFWGQRVTESTTDGTELAIGGGSVPYPTPTSFPWTIYPVTDDDDAGLWVLTVWLIPTEARSFKFRYRYVKDNGTYGRNRWSPSYDISDDERRAGRIEVEFGPLRPDRRMDIIRAITRQGKGRKAEELRNPPLETAEAGYGGAAPTAIPAAPPWSTNPPPYANQLLPALATILPGPYLAGLIEIRQVQTPTKETDGIHYPVGIAIQSGPGVSGAYLRQVKFVYAKVGTQAGGSNVYGRNQHTAWTDITDDQRTGLAGGSILGVDVGPVRPKRSYHILRAVGTWGIDDKGTRLVKTKYPVADASVATTPTDVSPVNSYNPPNATPGSTGELPTGSAALAVLSATGDIVSPPSYPVQPGGTPTGRVVGNVADYASEPDNDAEITLRIYATEGTAVFIESGGTDNRKTFDQVNVTHVFPVVCDFANLGDPTKWHKLPPMKVENDPVTGVSPYFVDYKFHRKIGKRIYILKNVSMNEWDNQNTANDSPPTGRVEVYVGGQSADINMITDFACLDDWVQEGTANASVGITWKNDVAGTGHPAVPKEIVCYCTKPGYDDGVVGAPIPPACTPQYLHKDDDASHCSSTSPWMIEKVINLARHKEYAAAGTFIKRVKLHTRAGKPKHFFFRISVVGENVAVNYKESAIVDNTPLNDVADTVAPGAPGAPTVKYKQGHLRLKTTQPTTGNKTIYDYEWLISDYSPPNLAPVTFKFLNEGAAAAVGVFTTAAPFPNDLAGASLDAGSGLDFEGEKISIRPGAPRMSIAITKAELATFAPNNLYAQVRAYNRFGTTEADGRGPWSAQVGPISIPGFEEGAVDTSKPAAPTSPGIKYRKGNLRLKANRPLGAGSETVYHYGWVIADHDPPSGGAGVWLTDADGGVTQASIAEIFTPGPRLSIPMKKADFATIVATTGNLYMRVRAYNKFTSDPMSDWSATTSVLTVAGMDGDNEKPTAAAGAPGAPEVATIGSGGLTVKYPIVDGRDFIRYDFAFTDAIGTPMEFNPITGVISATTATTLSTNGTTGLGTQWFEGSGKRWHSAIRRRDITQSGSYPFAGTNITPGTTVLNVAARCVDRDPDGNIRYGTWSGYSNVTFQPGGLDKDARLPEKHYAAGFRNYLQGGGFTHARDTLPGGGSANDVGKDWRTTPNGGTQISTSTASGITWTKSTHSVACVPTTTRAAGATVGICGKISKGAIQLGEPYTLTFLVRTLAGTAIDWEVEIVDDNGTVLASRTVDMTSTDSSYVMYSAQLTVTVNTASTTARQWLRIRPLADSGSSWTFDNLMLTRTHRAVPWDSHPEEDDKNPAAVLSDEGTSVGSVQGSGGSWNSGTTGGKLDTL